jgi:hypothetical protein
MRALSLFRQLEVGDATLGRIETQEGVQLCVTLEEQWVDKNGDGLGDKNVSRIPAGSYKGFRRMSPARGYEVFELAGVPGRGNIQIHKGNTTEDTLGCILLGTAFVKGEARISGSKDAFESFMAYLRDENEILLIVHDIAPAKAA